VITSVALITLLSTGLVIWGRRKLRRPRARRDTPRAAASLGKAA
jgi:hypothetical protein